VLGWSEKPPRGGTVNIPPEPKKSDYVSDTIKPFNPIKSYKDHRITIDFFGIGYRPTGKEKDGERIEGYDFVNEPEIIKNFTAMNNDFSLLLVSLKSGTLTRDEFISVVTTCNNTIDDMDKFNLQIIQDILDDENPLSRTEFSKNIISALKIFQHLNSPDIKY